MNQEMSQELAQQVLIRQDNLECRFGLLEQEFGCLFRFMRAMAPLNVASDLFEHIIKDWETVLERRQRFLISAHGDLSDEPTDPSIKKP